MPSPADDVDEVAGRDELLRILTGSARAGSVAAAKTLLEELRRDVNDDEQPGSGFDALDEVAARRDRKAS